MKPKAVITLSAIAGILLIYTGCDVHGPCIHGNEMVITEKRIVGSFNGISSESFFDVFIVQDSVDEVIVEAESNLMPYIQTWVSGSTLVLREHENHCLKTNFPVRITVKVRDLNRAYLTGSGSIIGNTELTANTFRLELTGSGVVDMDVFASTIEGNISGSGRIDLGAMTDQLNIRISGSGEIYLWGEAHQTNLEITGSGSIKAYGLVQDNCFVTITGSGDVYVYVNEYLDVRISGSGSVYYKGSPLIVTSITGSGSVIHQ